MGSSLPRLRYSQAAVGLTVPKTRDIGPHLAHVTSVEVLSRVLHEASALMPATGALDVRLAPMSPALQRYHHCRRSASQ